MSGSDLLAHAERLLPEALALLEEICAIDTGTGQQTGIGLVSELLGTNFNKLGFELEFVPAGEYGRHLKASRAGIGNRLLIVGHLDTVYPQGSARRPQLADGRLSGPGVYDCKGGLLVAWTACKLLAESGRPCPPLTILANCDEEIGSLSSRPLIEAEAARAAAVLVVEPAPAPQSVIVARKGIGRYQLKVYGRSAHAGSDRESGVNALVELAIKILALEEINTSAPGYTVTVGTATGGTRPNVIPDYAHAGIDLRITEASQIEMAESAIARAVAATRFVGASYRLEGGITRPPMPANEANLGLFAVAREAAAALGMTLAAASSGGGSDGNFCAALGVPVLDGMGPAGGGAHSDGEHIIPASLATRAALLAAVICRLGARGLRGNRKSG